MHGSIWTYIGDSDELVARYEALLDEVPQENQRFHACLSTPDGIIIFDTCPSKADYDAFFSSPDVQALFERHGLASPSEQVDFPIVRAYAAGARVDVTN